MVETTEGALNAALLKVFERYEVAPSALLATLKRPPGYWVIPAHRERARVAQALTALFKRPFELKQEAWALSLDEAIQALREAP